MILRRDPPTAGKLVAYWVPREKGEATSSSLHEHLAARLPDSMLPSAFVALDRLPLTPSGKVDRRALPAPEPGPPAAEHTGIAPRDPLQAGLVRIWSELLGIGPIGIHSNFFELGGDSLTAIRLFGRIESEFGRRLPPALIFRAPTVEKLAVELRDAPVRQARSSVVPVGVADTAPFFFLPCAGDPGMLAFELVRHLYLRQTVYTFDVDLPARPPHPRRSSRSPR